MLFTQDINADQFDLFMCGNLRGLEANNQHSSCTEMNLRGTNSNSHVTGHGKENIYGQFEASIFGCSFEIDSSVCPRNFSLSGLSGDSFQSSALDHDKRALSDAKPCQTACKRSDNNTWLYSSEERPLSSAVNISASALAEEDVETRRLEIMPANDCTSSCSDSSGISSPNQVKSTELESLHLPDWVTSFPGYFDDCGLVPGHNTVDHTDSPVHEYLLKRDVPIGPECQADIPEWRPRVSEITPAASGLVCPREFVPRDDDDSESDKWVRQCVVPMSSSSFDSIGDNKVDCECRDEGSIRCVRKHILEARENLKMSLGPDRFENFSLCEMGEAVAQRWTDEEEKRFQWEVLANPVSLGKNFWDYLRHAFPCKSSKELVSYYFNVFMLRRRAQQNRSDLLLVDSDDDELPDEPPVTEHREEDSAVGSVPST